MIINDNIFVMLLVESFFQTFTKKEVADASASTEVILALSAKSREEVDSLVQKALAAGGKASNDCSRSSTHLGRWRFQSVFAKWYMNRSRGSKSGSIQEAAFPEKRALRCGYERNTPIRKRCRGISFAQIVK